MTGNQTGSRTLGSLFQCPTQQKQIESRSFMRGLKELGTLFSSYRPWYREPCTPRLYFFFFNLVTGICLGPSVCQARTAPLRDTHNSVFFPFSHPDRFSQCDFVPQADCELEIFLLPPCVIRSKQKSLQMTHYTTEGLGISLWEEF